jgi:HD superfamily phosphohydrolase
LPELRALRTPSSIIRIPDQLNVPVTPRIRRLIDTSSFRRLARISQLGLVALVYPGATHSRFEHSLGVYRLGLVSLAHLATLDDFNRVTTSQQTAAFLVAALLHDIGHWPYCHPLEDLDHALIPRHETLARSWLEDDEIGSILDSEFGLTSGDIGRILAGSPSDAGEQILCSLLSGPIDIDKMDYLSRDSWHAGVPYGRHFDVQRLIDGLCVDASGARIAITEKGKTAAELMVFARYVMFSEVYWHHAVRAATAMLQRAVSELPNSFNWSALPRTDESSFVSTLTRSVPEPCRALVDGLFGSHRQLYKRWAEYGRFWQPERYARLARRPFVWLRRCAIALADVLSTSWKTRIQPHEVLIDAPPVHREIELQVDVYFPKQTTYRPLAEVSPVVQTLATHQFDDYVKRARVFVSPRVHALIPAGADIDELLGRAIDLVD